MQGTGNFSFDYLHIRLKRVILEFLLQKKVLSQRFWPGLMHALVFWGFIFFGAITIDHFLIGFNIICVMLFNYCNTCKSQRIFNI